MVDALLIAAQSEDSEYFEDKEDDVPHTPTPTRTQHIHPQVRICEFCGSSNTPTWRRGPGGKGSLCNACGIKWRLRKRTKKGDTADKTKNSYLPATVTLKSPLAKRKKRDTKDTPEHADHMTTLRNPIVFKENIQEITNIPLSPTSDSRKNYFCKFCNKTWDFHHFKNSQQFGAHCSNCSRRPQQDGLVPPSPYLDEFTSPSFSHSHSPSLSIASPPLSTPTKRFPPPPFDPGLNLILMLRYMQEEADLSDGETIAPPSPSTLSTPVL